MDLSVMKSSKLYKASSRKSRLDVMAVSVIGNAGLAVQKAYQVDIPESDDATDGKKTVSVSRIDKIASDKNSSTGENASNDISDKSIQHSSSHVVDSIQDLSGLDDSEPENIGESSDNSDISKTSVSDDSAVTNDSKDTVESSTGVSLPRIDVTENMSLEVEDIKGLLNPSSDTAGVSRIRCKDDEAWVYYNDDVNLNDVMVPAIELLNRPGYTYLEFNRLARSDNAIVFVILKEDTDRFKKPESEVSESVSKES